MSRVGEVAYNNFGSKMEIIAYRGYNDIDVYFPQYNWTFKNTKCNTFKKGKIKCPYEPRIYGVGYIGEGKYKTTINGKNTKVFQEWTAMLYRCYNNSKNPTYEDCEVNEEWYNFQNFAEWFYENYYEVPNENMCLDKDIYYKNKREYSSETCLFVPERINKLFCRKRNNKADLELPIGVSHYKNTNRYLVRCRTYVNGKSISNSLGIYNTIEEAFEVYKNFKENYIKQVADEYYDKGLIPKELYKAMYEYEVEITD